MKYFINKNVQLRNVQFYHFISYRICMFRLNLYLIFIKLTDVLFYFIFWFQIFSYSTFTLQNQINIFFSFSYPIGKMSHLFYQHGRFCASHPWEVMITFLTLSICIFSLGPSAISSSEQRRQTIEQSCLKEQNSQWNSNASKHCTSQVS